jgi:hypothetical protein
VVQRISLYTTQTPHHHRIYMGIQKERRRVGRKKQTKLGKIYEKQEGVEVIVLIHKLVNLKIKESDVEDYLSKFDGMIRDIEKRWYNLYKHCSSSTWI